MNSSQIIQLVQEAARALGTDTDEGDFERIRINQRDYSQEDLPEFMRDLTECAKANGMLLLSQNIPILQLKRFLEDGRDPIVIFHKTENNVKPDLLTVSGKKRRYAWAEKQFAWNDVDNWLTDEDGCVRLLIVVPYRDIVNANEQGNQSATPVQRLLRLLRTEKKDITYILIYAIIVGLLSLILPLGLQTTIEFISGGVFFSSVYILIALIILGTIATGVLQIVQISIVEQLQRRVFVKAALEFAYRLPRVRLEALARTYAPELVNRFFDIMTIQKGLPKLLLDLSSGVIQVMFGLMLLSLYHPFFVFFSLFLIVALIIMFYFTGPRGLESSINESKYKYKVVQWLEEIARTLKAFKLAGNTDLTIRKADQYAGNYVKYRKKHFSVLLVQFSFFVLFKVAIVGGLLIMGTVLVVERQITLGQFVASEVIIILVLNAVEKIILYMDVVYDLLTAVDKVAHVTDLPLEKSGTIDIPDDQHRSGYSVSVNNLAYRYGGDTGRAALNNINLEIASGERVCIAGPGESGKTTLTNIIGGLYSGYSGAVAINRFSLRDLDIAHLRNHVAKNISPDDIFDGTLYENVTIGKSTARVHEVLNALEKVGLLSYVNALPEGINTPVVSGGKGLSSSTIYRLIMARCLAKKPRLMILNDFFSGLSKVDKLDLIRCAIDRDERWTLIAVSNDPLVMASCDRVVILDKGMIVDDDNYSALLKRGIISKYFE